MKHIWKNKILSVSSWLKAPKLSYIIITLLIHSNFRASTNCNVPPAEQMFPSFETTASGKNKRTGIVLLRPLHAMQGWSLVDKRLDETQTSNLMRGRFSRCFQIGPNHSNFKSSAEIHRNTHVLSNSVTEMHSQCSFHSHIISGACTPMMWTCLYW